MTKPAPQGRMQLNLFRGLQHLFQLAVLMHSHHDVSTTYEFTVDEHLPQKSTAAAC